MTTLEQIRDGVDVLLTNLGVTQEDGPPGGVDGNGTYYTTLLHSGAKKEGERVPWYGVNSEEVWGSYQEELLKWLAGRRRIVWRSRPTLDTEEYKDRKRQVFTYYVLYSRLTAY